MLEDMPSSVILSEAITKLIMLITNSIFRKSFWRYQKLADTLNQFVNDPQCILSGAMAYTDI